MHLMPLVGIHVSALDTFAFGEETPRQLSSTVLAMKTLVEFP